MKTPIDWRWFGSKLWTNKSSRPWGTCQWCRDLHHTSCGWWFPATDPTCAKGLGDEWDMVRCIWASFHMKQGKQRLQKITQKWELDDTRIVRKPKVIGTSHLEKTHLNLTFCFPMSSGFVFAWGESEHESESREKGTPQMAFKMLTFCWYHSHIAMSKSGIPTPKQFPGSLLILGADVLKLATFFDRSYPIYHIYLCLPVSTLNSVGNLETMCETPKSSCQKCVTLYHRSEVFRSTVLFCDLHGNSYWIWKYITSRAYEWWLAHGGYLDFSKSFHGFCWKNMLSICAAPRSLRVPWLTSGDKPGDLILEPPTCPHRQKDEAVWVNQWHWWHCGKNPCHSSNNHTEFPSK